jgi:hypothetical protein
MGKAVPDHTIDGLHYDTKPSVFFLEQATVLVDVSPIDVVHTPIVLGFLGTACIPIMLAIYTIHHVDVGFDHDHFL